MSATKGTPVCSSWCSFTGLVFSIAYFIGLDNVWKHVSTVTAPQIKVPVLWIYPSHSSQTNQHAAITGTWASFQWLYSWIKVTLFHPAVVNVQQLLSQGFGLGGSLSPPCLEILLAGSCADLVWAVSVALSSCVNQTCDVRMTALHSTPLALSILSAAFVQRSLSHEGGELIEIAHLRLRTYFPLGTECSSAITVTHYSKKLR